MKSKYDELLEQYDLAIKEHADGVGTIPHCDARLLHAPPDCVYCAQATDLQKVRETLGLSNTGLQNRAWPCPGDKARSAEVHQAWGGNRPMTDKDIADRQEYWTNFNRELDRLVKQDDDNALGFDLTDDD